jgi:hypothetical protein
MLEADIKIGIKLILVLFVKSKLDSLKFSRESNLQSKKTNKKLIFFSFSYHFIPFFFVSVTFEFIYYFDKLLVSILFYFMN